MLQKSKMFVRVNKLALGFLNTVYIHLVDDNDTTTVSLNNLGLFTHDRSMIKALPCLDVGLGYGCVHVLT